VEAGAFDAMGERDDLRLAQEEPPRRRRAASKRRGEAGAGGQLEIPFDGEA
jgi:hypothetical protein